MARGPIVSARIHPGIGIARVGNSPEYFIGPEVANPVDPPKGGYRDTQGRLKRQAARFRVYGYNEDGEVVEELTSANADIEWTVHIANKKAAWYRFDVALDIPEAANIQSSRRNAQIQGTDRAKLVIDPGARSVSGPKQKPEPFDTGKFFDTGVYLGELHTDEDGRLLFIGGRGKSGTPFSGNTLTTFANNSGWYDDTSDGPVSATVLIHGEKTPIPVDPAWVVTAPPNYAPDLVTPQTMYDVISDALSSNFIKTPSQPSFTRDILPLLRQFNQAQWVNAGFLAQFGWTAPNDFTREDFLTKLSTAPNPRESDPQKADPFGEFRRQIFYSFRNPSATAFNGLAWPPLYGDAFGNFDNPPSPRAGFSVTKTIYNFLMKWMQGNFVADFDPKKSPRDPKSIGEVPLADQPAELDRAALHFCMGGPFHPGCEMTWTMRALSSDLSPLMFRSSFRIRQLPDGVAAPDYGDHMTQAIALAPDGPLAASGPGDVTKWMAVPWQSDTASCRAAYSGSEFPSDPLIPAFWPARVPNHVLTEKSYEIVINDKDINVRRRAFYNRAKWWSPLGLKKPFIEQLTNMVNHFGELPLIEKRVAPADPDFPAVMYVAAGIEAEGAEGLEDDAEGAQDTAEVDAAFARARFPRAAALKSLRAK